MSITKFPWSERIGWNTNKEKNFIYYVQALYVTAQVNSSTRETKGKTAAKVEEISTYPIVLLRFKYMTLQDVTKRFVNSLRINSIVQKVQLWLVKLKPSWG